MRFDLMIGDNCLKPVFDDTWWGCMYPSCSHSLGILPCTNKWTATNSNDV